MWSTKSAAAAACVRLLHDARCTLHERKTLSYSYVVCTGCVWLSACNADPSCRCSDTQNSRCSQDVLSARGEARHETLSAQNMVRYTRTKRRRRGDPTAVDLAYPCTVSGFDMRQSLSYTHAHRAAAYKGSGHSPACAD